MPSGRTLVLEFGGGGGTTVHRGVMYQERPRRQIPCPDGGVELTTGLMTAHRWRMHGTEPEIDWNRLPVSQTEHILQVSEISFLKVVSQRPFPVCPGSSQTWNGLTNHFDLQHWGESLWVLYENPIPLPKYKRCGSQVPPWRLDNWHYESNKFQLEEEKRIRWETL